MNLHQRHQPALALLLKPLDLCGAEDKGSTPQAGRGRPAVQPCHPLPRSALSPAHARSLHHGTFQELCSLHRTVMLLPSAGCGSSILSYGSPASPPDKVTLLFSSPRALRAFQSPLPFYIYLCHHCMGVCFLLRCASSWGTGAVTLVTHFCLYSTACCIIAAHPIFVELMSKSHHCS